MKLSSSHSTIGPFSLALAAALAIAVSASACVPRKFNAPTRSSGKSEDTQPPSAETDVPGVKDWVRERVKGAEASFASSGAKRLPSPSWWGNEVVYQIQVDRFADGDESNNQLNVEENQTRDQATNEKGLAHYRHGGDIQGIIGRLDYLKGLGVTSLWVTPILQSNGSYHGYCTSDFTRIDPGFSKADPEEGRALFRKLVSEAHARGLKVILDIVVNHVCDKKTRYDDARTPFNRGYYTKCVQTRAGKNWAGSGGVVGARDIAFGDSFFKPLRNKDFLSRCGNGGGEDGDAAVWGDFSSAMLDFDTNNWDFQEIFTELHKYWIAYADVDGFRVDAAKHVTSDFLAYFSTSVRAYAASLGKKNFTLVGEVAGSADDQAERVGSMRTDPRNPDAGRGRIAESLRARLWKLKDDYLAHAAFPRPGLNSIYDFSHSGATVEVNRGGAAPMAIKSWFWAGGETEASAPGLEFGKLMGQSDTRENWNVLEIHDWPRFLTYSRAAKEGTRSGNPAYNALGYLLTTQGVPVLYYGIEQGLNGDCHADKIRVDGEARRGVDEVCKRDDHSNHARYRQDMFLAGPWRLGSVEPRINALAGIGRQSVPSSASREAGIDPYLDTTSGLYQYLSKLIAIRKSCGALRHGSLYFRAAHGKPASAGGGFFAFSRILNANEIVVAVNTRPASIFIDSLTVDAGISSRASRFANLLNPSEKPEVVGGKLKIGRNLAPNSVAIYASNAMNNSTSDEFALCTE